MLAAGGSMGLLSEDLLVHVCELTLLHCTVLGASLTPFVYLNYQVVTYDYGQKEKDPLAQAPFYTKSAPDVPGTWTKTQLPSMLPQSFSVKHVRVYCTKWDTNCHEAARK